MLRTLVVGAVLVSALDIVELNDGQRLVGTIRSTGNEIELLTPAGVRKVAKSETRRILKRAELLATFRQTKATLGEEERAQATLCDWALRHGLYEQCLDLLDQLLEKEGFEAPAQALLVRARQEALLDDLAPYSAWSKNDVQALVGHVAGKSAARSDIAKSWILARPTEDSVPGLERALGSVRVERRLAAAELLGELHPATSLGTLIETSLYDRKPQVREAALRAAQSYQHPRLSRPYIQAIDAAKPATREAAYNAVATLMAPRAVPALIRRLARRADSGGPPRNHVSFTEQISFLQDFEVEIAQGAVIADPVVGILRQGTVLDVRATATVSIPGGERRRLAALLGKLTGQNFGENAGRWAQWWNQNGKAYLEQMLSASMAERQE